MLFTVTSTALPWDFYFFKLTQPLITVSAVQLMYTVKWKGGKPNRNGYPSPYGLRSMQKPQVWELSRLCPEAATILFVYEFGFGTLHRQSVYRGFSNAFHYSTYSICKCLSGDYHFMECWANSALSLSSCTMDSTVSIWTHKNHPVICKRTKMVPTRRINKTGRQFFGWFLSVYCPFNEHLEVQGPVRGHGVWPAALPRQQGETARVDGHQRNIHFLRL